MKKKKLRCDFKNLFILLKILKYESKMKLRRAFTFLNYCFFVEIILSNKSCIQYI